jgi:hypothetical protein
MKHFGFFLTGLAVLLVVSGFALLMGIDPWLLARIFVLSVPISAYVVISHGILIMKHQGRRSVWHGVPIVLSLVLGPNLAKLKNLTRLTLSGGLSGAGTYTQSSLLLFDCVVHSHSIAFSLRLTPARRS